MNALKITKATIDDVLTLQTIGRQTFSETFADVNSEENMKISGRKLRYSKTKCRIKQSIIIFLSSSFRRKSHGLPKIEYS